MVSVVGRGKTLKDVGRQSWSGPIVHDPRQQDRLDKIPHWVVGLKEKEKGCFMGFGTVNRTVR